MNGAKVNLSDTLDRGRGKRWVFDRTRHGSDRPVARSTGGRRRLGSTQRLASNVTFNRHAGASPWETFRPRFGPLAFAFALTGVWFMLNVRRLSPLDILPFAWTWLTLWLALSIGLDLWRRWLGASMPNRQRIIDRRR